MIKIRKKCQNIKKPKDSNTSKSNHKSKHKHHYEECLIQYDFTFNMKTYRPTFLCSYCTECGKIGKQFKNTIVKNLVTKHMTDDGNIYYSHITDEELYEKYHNKMPVFFIEDMSNKYVVLDQNDE